jgi:hypothetical protein
VGLSEVLGRVVLVCCSSSVNAEKPMDKGMGAILYRTRKGFPSYMLLGKGDKFVLFKVSYLLYMAGIGPIL